MQIPLWQFLACILIAAAWHDMASLLLRQSISTAGLRVRRYISPSVSSTLSRFTNQFFTTTPHASISTSSSTKMPSSTAFLEAIKARRTHYAITNTSPIPDSKIQEIINETVLHIPSAFNSQSTRVVLLLKAEHEKLWDITTDVLRAIVPAEQFPATEQRMRSFKAGYGTVRPFPSQNLSSYQPHKHR
jgi:hypothetical protein